MYFQKSLDFFSLYSIYETYHNYNKKQPILFDIFRIYWNILVCLFRKKRESLQILFFILPVETVSAIEWPRLIELATTRSLNI